MKNIKGFTLIEVIVTITLLAVLMAIVVPISLSYMDNICLLYTSPSPRDQRGSRMPSSA